MPIHTARLIHTSDLDNETIDNAHRLLVEAYGGQIAFARSALGGLAVILQLARAPDDRTTDT